MASDSPSSNFELKDEKSRFPGARSVDRTNLRAGLAEEFEAAIAKDSEEALQVLITENPILLQYVALNQGGGGILVFPKQLIRTRRVDGTPGLIPDYLVCSLCSMGYEFQIVELKKATVQFSKPSGTAYTRDAADGIAQCAKYYSHFAQYIETVRVNTGLPIPEAPSRVVLLIGDSSRETEIEKSCRREFVMFGSRLHVASYDRIRRGLARDLRNIAG